MKTPVAVLLALSAFVAAAIVMYANAGLGGIAFTALGAAAMLALDYGGRIEPVRARARVVPMEAPDHGDHARRKAA